MTPKKQPATCSEIHINGKPHILVYADQISEEDAYHGVLVQGGAVSHYLSKPRSDETAEELHATIIKELLHDHEIERNGCSAEDHIEYCKEVIENLRKAVLTGRLTEEDAQSFIEPRLKMIAEMQKNPESGYVPPQEGTLDDYALNALIAAHHIVTSSDGQQFIAHPVDELLKPVPIAYYLNDVAKTLETGRDLDQTITRGGNYIPVPRSVRVELQRMDRPPSLTYSSNNICPN